MDSEAFQDALKDFMATSLTGCPWLGTKAPPTASEIAFSWPSPRLEPSGRHEAHCYQDDMDSMNLFRLFDMNGDGLVNVNDFRLFKVIWGVQLDEIDADGKREIDLSDFVNMLSSSQFKIGEPLCHTAVYRLVNSHPCKVALLQAQISKLIARIRKNHWGKVQSLINEDKIKDYWMIFSLFDANGDGHLTIYDFETLMLIWGLCPTDAADVLDKFDEVDGTIDFGAFVNLVDSLDLQTEEPLYHYALFSLVEYHLQAAFMPEAELWNFSAKIRRNFCGREECLLMEYRSRSCKMAFSLFDMDGDGRILSNDFYTLLRTWPLDVSSLHYQEGTIDFENFLQVFPSINMCACDKGALNLLKYNEQRGLLPPAAIRQFRQISQNYHSRWEAAEQYKLTLRKIFELNRIFSLLDYDEDDHLTAKEVETLACACKLPSTVTTDIIDKVDLIWGGKIDFGSLLKLFKPSTMNPFRIIESPSGLFELLDRDGDGFLSLTDFKRFASIIGQEFSDQEFEGLMLDLDIQGSGRVGYLAFCRSMQETWNPSILELNLDDTVPSDDDDDEVPSDEEVDPRASHVDEFTNLWELDKTLRHKETRKVFVGRESPTNWSD